MLTFYLYDFHSLDNIYFKRTLDSIMTAMLVLHLIQSLLGWERLMFYTKDWAVGTIVVL